MDSTQINYVTTLTEDRVREIVREETASASDLIDIRLRALSFACGSFSPGGADRPDDIVRAAEQFFAFLMAGR